MIRLYFRFEDWLVNPLRPCWLLYLICILTLSTAMVIASVPWLFFN